MDPHQVNFQPNILLFNFCLRFNPTPTFLEVTFDHTLFLFNYVSSRNAKFLPRLKALRCFSTSSQSLSVLYKSFLRFLLTYVSPKWFPFLSVTNITKLKRLHRAANRNISSCLSSSLILLLSKGFSTFSSSHPDSFCSVIL